MNKITISGSMSAASQLFAGKYQHAQITKLSPYQQRLFEVATRGYNAFTKEEQARLTYNDRKLVEKSFGVTRRVLNEMRQQMNTNTISALFNKLFPNAQGSGLSFLMMPVTDKTMTTHIPVKVPKEALIKRLIAESVLPKNFYQKAA